MICATDGGIMTTIFAICGQPEYHGIGIGKHLVNEVKDIYNDYLRTVVVGMMRDASPLFITDLCMRC